MPKTEHDDMARVHIWLYKSDIERINALYGSNIGFSKAIRLLLRKFLKEIDAKAAAKATVPAFSAEDLPEALREG